MRTRDGNQSEACLTALSNPNFEAFSIDQEILFRMVQIAVRVKKKLAGIVELHPLGFARVSFGDHRLSDGYHLHYWSQKLPRRPHCELPHAHAFDLTSNVLRGQLTNVLWHSEEDSQGAYNVVPFDSRSTGSRALLDQARPVTMWCAEEQLVMRGQTYSMPAGIFHTTVIHDDPTITLIRKMYDRGRPSFAAFPRSDSTADDGTYDHYTDHVSQEEVWDRIEAALK